MIARFSLFGAVCFLAVPFQRAVAKEACELPALEAVGASADRPDQGCAAVVRALAVKRLTEAKADDADPHADEMHALPKAEDIARCSALLLGKGGRFFLEPDVDADQWLPGGLAMQGIQDLRQTFSRGRTAEAASTVAYNAVTFAACDIHFPVYVDYAAPISGFGRSRDGRYLWVVHAGDRRYSGASVPYYLKGSALSVVDLKTLTTQHISLDALGFEIQSIAATIEGEQLLVRLKDVWNLGRDKRLYLQCSLSATTCELKPTLSPTGFPKQGVLEVTASDIYWWEDLPVSAKLPPDVNVLRRTVRVSPDQKQMTYVVEKNDNHRVSRTLFVADLSGRKARRVASGIGLFHVEWLSPDRFVFEEDPKPTAAFTAIHQKAMATPEAKALIAEAKKSKDDYLQSSLDLWVLRYVEGEIQEGRLKPLSPRDAQEERLFEYRTTTGKVTPFNKLRHARLFGEFLYPNARADVPAD